ncbi:ribosome silencing factor [Schaalia naturae]|uniref:Ribosomal silencing factor RsfS n=1 Tax=Schaalia naturae TaxID=635203 RepID=A0ABW2SKX7_9ACTO
MTVGRDTLDILSIAAEAAADKLATKPVVVDVSGRLGISDAFLIASAPTDRQVRAIAEEVMDRVSRDRGVLPLRIEGRVDARWVLLDYGMGVVHVLTEEDREYYALEKLWGDCPQVAAEELASADLAWSRAAV